MFLFQFAIIPISLSVAGTIPLVLNGGSAIPVVSVKIGSRSPADHKIFLGNKNVNHVSERIPERFRERLMRTFRAPCTFAGSDISMQFRRRTWQVTSDAQSGGDWLAIGPGSELVTAYNSVDFVRSDNGTRLILGGSEESFLSQHCLPNTIVRIPTISRTLGPNQMDDWFAIGSAHATEMDPFNVIFEFNDKENLLEMGFANFGRLFAKAGLMRLFNVERINDVGRFVVPNCDDDNLRRFPNIRLSFFAVDENQNVGGEAGRFVLTPFDYITRRRDGTCWMSVVLTDVEQDERLSSPIIHLNPMLLPYINTRSTADGAILACRRPN